MKITPKISFEIFPPNNEKASSNLWKSVKEMSQFDPDFVSVTFGAGGSAHAKSIQAIEGLMQNTGVNIAAHLTCAGASKSEIDFLANKWWELGVRKIVALRGDLPNIARQDSSNSDIYPDSVSLISGLRKVRPFQIFVAAYPEPHPESKSPNSDLEHLKQKMDAGATAAITQYFFEPEIYYRFRDRCAASGIEQEIIPGILPISNFNKVVEFSKRCGATVPQWMHKQFSHLDQNSTVAGLVAAANSCGLCRELQREGVEKFHIYTMNRSEIPSAICRCLGLEPNIRMIS